MTSAVPKRNRVLDDKDDDEDLHDNADVSDSDGDGNGDGECLTMKRYHDR